MDPEVKAAYQRLEDAITEVARLEEADGVLTDWVIVTAHQRFDGEGDALTQVGKLLPGAGGNIPYHRIMGLLDYALTLCRAEVVDA